MIGLLSSWVFGMIELRKWIEYLWTGKEIRREKHPDDDENIQTQ